MRLWHSPAVRALLTAVAVGLLVGGGAALGWARETPAALGFFTFAGVVIGNGLSRLR